VAVNNWDTGKAALIGYDRNSQPASNCGKEVVSSEVQGELARLPFRTACPTFQALEEVQIEMDKHGARRVSQLSDSKNGGLVLSTLHENGDMVAELLTRLPKEISSDFKAALLDTGCEEGVHGRRRVFLDRADEPFKTHSLGSDIPVVTFPLVLHRQQSTIPTAVVRGHCSLEEGLSTAEQSRKRIGSFEDERKAKR
jgi:hypothetical protein